jgi:hypothetical protein
MLKKLFNRLRSRIFKINASPFSEWEVIIAEPEQVSWHMKNFVLPMTIAIAITTFLGYYLLALNIHNYILVYSAIKALASFCEAFFTLWVSALIIKELLVKLKVSVGFIKLFKLLAYSFSAFFTAAIISGFLSNYNTLGSFLKFLGLFGIFPFWIGCEIVLKLSPEKRARLILVSLAVILIVYFLINWSFGFALRAAHFAGMLNENQ